MQKTDILIIGASALSLMLAKRFRERCLIVDEGISAAAEFADALQAQPVDVHRAWPELTGNFLNALYTRELCDMEGRLHILPIDHLVCYYFLRTCAHMRVMTQCVSCEQTNDGILVTLFSPQIGYETVLAHTCIDTRIQPWHNCRKSFGLMLAQDPDLTAFDDGEAYMFRGRFDDEWILRLRVPRNTQLPDAQIAADRWISAHPERIGHAKVVGIGLSFGYTFDAPQDEIIGGVRYIPSASYPDILSAMEGGELLCL